MNARDSKIYQDGMEAAAGGAQCLTRYTHGTGGLIAGLTLRDNFLRVRSHAGQHPPFCLLREVRLDLDQALLIAWMENPTE